MSTSPQLLFELHGTGRAPSASGRVSDPQTLRYMRRGNISVISTAVGRSILPFMLDKHLVAGAVVIEKRRDCARRGIARREMGVDECGRRATNIRRPVAIGTR